VRGRWGRAGAVVEFVFDGQQVAGRVDAEIGSFREVVAQQATVFSLLSRCQGEWESQKETGAPSDR
jgi:hypothetical protein